MLDKLPILQEKFESLEKQLSDPEVIADSRRYADLAREHRELLPILKKFDDYVRLMEQIRDDEDILSGSDDELKAIVRGELDSLQEQQEQMENKLKMMLVPKDPADRKNAIVEIRAGTGGEEAALFAGDLLRMYQRFAEASGWKLEFLGLHELGGGGVKEVSFQVSGDGVFGHLKYESGVHRVQRIPATESSGRIHTSAATVAILPEAEEVDVQIDQADLRIDTYRASGAGGQHVNKTDSAIRITHLPTNLVVTCQDEKSQFKNKEKALRVLRARLLQQEQEKLASQRADMRKSLVSTGDRSAKIRTYNFPQGRVTDHRINLTLYRLEEIINGDLTELIDALITADTADQLAEL
ncbi:MAG: peptide chain release factor 1 [Candidatus Marinimicrobia bacterium]|nr:peptide chain release factor 1 [Candidatus Neomarinimicrobiota bacterium]MCF7839670.1 peptide chain release factor 1 [Candidatus Neomarinimicrobiota bacterium]MCF7903274.1 peptide chain release factor 1 [Candidatus Neomarinimicrobiota bacterium]